MSTTTLSERILKAMEGPPKVKQVDLAKACKVATSSVNDWISGKTKTLSAECLVCLSEYLNVRPKWLLKGEGPMRSPMQNINLDTDDEDLAELIKIWNKTPKEYKPHFRRLADSVQQLETDYKITPKQNNGS